MSPQVYLLHFERPIGNPDVAHGRAQHYIGWATNLAARVAKHRRGQGSALMAAVVAAGIPFVVARTWEGERELERRLKRRKRARDLCPVCRQGQP